MVSETVPKDEVKEEAIQEEPNNNQSISQVKKSENIIDGIKQSEFSNNLPEKDVDPKEGQITNA